MHISTIILITKDFQSKALVTRKRAHIFRVEKSIQNSERLKVPTISVGCMNIENRSMKVNTKWSLVWFSEGRPRLNRSQRQRWLGV